LQIFIFALLGAIAGCREEPGRVRARQDEIVGVYEAKFQQGYEKLELKSDHSYIQDFVSENRPIHHTGSWEVKNHLLDGSDIILLDAVVSEDETIGSTPRKGDRILNVHNRSGRLALALNEVADWYFVRVN